MKPKHNSPDGFVCRKCGGTNYEPAKKRHQFTKTCSDCGVVTPNSLLTPPQQLSQSPVAPAQSGDKSMAKHRFRVFNTTTGDHISVAEMDETLLEKLVEEKVMHPDTGTLRGIKNGGVYTLIPVDDHTVATLRRVHDVFKNVTEKPAKMFSTSLNRIDELIIAVGLLFGEVTYDVVEDKNDLNNIINPPNDPDFQRKKVKYTILGDMLKNAEEAAGAHTCGPECNHDDK